jgi:hypothetical protein
MSPWRGPSLRRRQARYLNDESGGALQQRMFPTRNEYEREHRKAPQRRVCCCRGGRRSAATRR